MVLKNQKILALEAKLGKWASDFKFKNNIKKIEMKHQTLNSKTIKKIDKQIANRIFKLKKNIRKIDAFFPNLHTIPIDDVSNQNSYHHLWT